MTAILDDPLPMQIPPKGRITPDMSKAKTTTRWTIGFGGFLTFVGWTYNAFQHIQTAEGAYQDRKDIVDILMSTWFGPAVTVAALAWYWLLRRREKQDQASTNDESFDGNFFKPNPIHTPDDPRTVLREWQDKMERKRAGSALKTIQTFHELGWLKGTGLTPPNAEPTVEPQVEEERTEFYYGTKPANPATLLPGTPDLPPTVLKRTTRTRGVGGQRVEIGGDNVNSPIIQTQNVEIHRSSQTVNIRTPQGSVFFLVTGHVLSKLSAELERGFSDGATIWLRVDKRQRGNLQLSIPAGCTGTVEDTASLDFIEVDEFSIVEVVLTVNNSDTVIGKVRLHG